MNSTALLHIKSDVSGVTADWPFIHRTNMYVFNIEAMNSTALLHIMSDVSGVTADWPIIPSQ